MEDCGLSSESKEKYDVFVTEQDTVNLSSEEDQYKCFCVPQEVSLLSMQLQGTF